MKSFLVVRSQSQTSTDNRRSLSVGFNLLERTEKGFQCNAEIRDSICTKILQQKSLDLQRERLIPVWVQSGTDGFCFLFTFILRIWDELQLNIRI